MRKIISAIIISVQLNFCVGQSFTTINYSIAEGLPSSEVYEIYQDKNKFLWFATDNGVVRFDGNEMRTFGVEHGLSDPVVFGFYEDQKGRLWFRTFSAKLSYYDPRIDKIIRYKYNDKLTAHCKNSFLWAIHLDSLEQLWFGANFVWGKIDSSGNVSLNRVKNDSHIYYEKIGNTYLYGVASSNYGRISINGKRLTQKSPGYPWSHPVLSVVEWKNKFYFSINKDLFQYDGIKITQVLGSDKGIINLSKDSEDNLWVGYYEGVERYSTDDFKNPLILPFFNDKAVTEVLQDHEKGLWVSTVGNGIFYIPNFNVKNQTLPVTSNIINACALNDHVVIGHRQGIMLVDKDNYSIKGKKYLERVEAHIIDREKNIWVATNKGTIGLDSVLNLRIKMPVSKSVSNFYDDRKGVLWSINKNFVTAFRTKDTLRIVSKRLDYLYRSIAIEDSLIYLTARTGLHIYDKELNLIKELQQLADYKFSKVLPLNDSILLLTTIGDGFFILNKKTWKEVHFNLKNKFIANHIYTAIATDSSLWFGTEKGIVKTNIKALLNRVPSFELLTKKKGLIADKVNLLLEVDDNIWAFFDYGFSIFPKDIPISTGKPVFYLKPIMVNNEPKKLQDGIRFSYDQNNFMIDYSFIAFNNQNIFVRYRMRKEDGWVHTTDRSLKFYSLSPGSYHFEFDYSLDNAHWHHAMTSPQFIIDQPWWRTWYFILSMAFLLIFIVSLYFANRVFIYRQHQRKLIQFEIEAIEHERTRIAKDLHDSVGTDFSAIKMMVNQLLQKHQEPKSAEIETQFQNTIHEIKNIIYGLSPPGLERYGLIAGLNNYIEKINGTMSVHIKFNSFGKEIKDLKISITVFRIVQELVSNSLKHANATSIALHINSFSDLLNIVYEDNGNGFYWNASSKGLGLYNIESRIQSLNGHLCFDSGTFGVSYTIDIPLKN